MFRLTKTLILSVLGVLSLVQAISAQVVRSIPRFPSDTDTVTILFDATEGNGALAGVSPPIYAHTGVITNLSTGPSDWRFVQGTWGQASPNTEMTPLGNNRYSISYVPRTFYNVPAAQTILELAFVFRNTNGSIVGRSADGSDIYLPIYAAGQLHSRIFSPSDGQRLVQPGDSIPFFGAASQSCSLRLYVNGVLQQSVVGDSLATHIHFPTSGNYQLVFQADNGSSIAADTLSMVALPGSAAQPLPAGIREGINYLNDSTVTLALYAPHKSFVFVQGDFNDWELNANYYMNRSPDSNWYWLTITNLSPGVEYAYQYLIDGTLRVADAFTEKILDPSNDRFIPASTYPNLKPYPMGKTTGIVSILQTAKPAYAWQNNNFTPPASTDLIIYELLVRDFIADQRYQSLIDSLDYLQRLGINCIQLLPIKEFEGNNSWGYNPSFFLAADKAYGTEYDLRAFIDSCHGRGIAVVLDMVLNHAFGQCPLVQMWWDPANNRPAANSPYFNPVPKHDFNVGYDFNHESPATRRLVQRVVNHWIEEYRFDGYRFDLSKGFTQNNTLGNIGAWNAYDSSRVAIWKEIYDSIRVISQHAYVILEHFSDNSEERELANYGMMFWGNMNYNFNDGTMGFASGSNLQWASHRTRGWNHPNLIAFAESHDEERLMFRNMNFGNQTAEHDTRAFSTAIKRMELVPVFLYSIPGPKMIWQFGELGYDFSINRCPNGTINNNCRTDPKPIRWDYFVNPERRYLYNIYSAMAKLKTTEAAFATDSFALTLGGAFKQIRLFHPSMDVVVVGNWGMSSSNFSASFSQMGWWYDYFSGDSINITTNNTTLTLAAGEYRVFTSKRLAAPDLSLSNRNTTTHLRQMQLYPNPSNTEVHIRLKGVQSGEPSKLGIFDLNGRLIREMEAESLGTEADFLWDLRNKNGQRVAPGLYVIKSAAGHTQKLVVTD
ncbi:MAG: alpha-amylase family glycosyl hydrolase [Bacteroidia bacterium]